MSYINLEVPSQSGKPPSALKVEPKVVQSPQSAKAILLQNHYKHYEKYTHRLKHTHRNINFRGNSMSRINQSLRNYTYMQQMSYK